MIESLPYVAMEYLDGQSLEEMLGSGQPLETGLAMDVITQILPRVDPADTSWLDPNGSERLTLQTSTGPTGLQPRFIAVAQRLAQVGD